MLLDSSPLWPENTARCLDKCEQWSWEQSNGERKEGKSFFVEADYAEVRIVFLFNPSTLIRARDDYEKLVVMILLNNGHCKAGADAAFAFRADCEKADGVLHGWKGDGGE